MPRHARLDARPLLSPGFRIPEFRRIRNSPELATRLPRETRVGRWRTGRWCIASCHGGIEINKIFLINKDRDDFMYNQSRFIRKRARDRKIFLINCARSARTYPLFKSEDMKRISQHLGRIADFRYIADSKSVRVIISSPYLQFSVED